MIPTDLQNAIFDLPWVAHLSHLTNQTMTSPPPPAPQIASAPTRKRDQVKMIPSLVLAFLGTCLLLTSFSSPSSSTARYLRQTIRRQLQFEAPPPINSYNLSATNPAIVTLITSETNITSLCLAFQTLVRATAYPSAPIVALRCWSYARYDRHTDGMYGISTTQLCTHRFAIHHASSSQHDRNTIVVVGKYGIYENGLDCKSRLEVLDLWDMEQHGH